MDRVGWETTWAEKSRVDQVLAVGESDDEQVVHHTVPDEGGSGNHRLGKLSEQMLSTRLWTRCWCVRDCESGTEKVCVCACVCMCMCVCDKQRTHTMNQNKHERLDMVWIVEKDSGQGSSLDAIKLGEQLVHDRVSHSRRVAL